MRNAANVLALRARDCRGAERSEAKRGMKPKGGTPKSPVCL